jgi:putative hydrolase of the HAD superfamily
VLHTARAYGIAHTIAISRPDSSAGQREIEGFTAVPGVAELVD